MLDIACIEFSETNRWSAGLLIGDRTGWQLLSKDVRQIAGAIRKSGQLLRMAKSHQQITDDSTREEREAIIAEALQAEREQQQTLAAAGITDDTTANQWLTPIEEKLKIARSEYQKISDRHLQEVKDFCNQWMVTE